MSDNYSVHHFQRTVGGTVTGGETDMSHVNDGGGIPTTAKYFDYTVNFRTPTALPTEQQLNTTDPIIDIDIESRTIRMLAKKSFIEIVDDKGLYNARFDDQDTLHHDTNSTLHEGDTVFKDNVEIHKELEVTLATTLLDKLHVFDDVLMDKELVVEGDITADEINYRNDGGGAVSERIRYILGQFGGLYTAMDTLTNATSTRITTMEGLITDLTARVAALE